MSRTFSRLLLVILLGVNLFLYREYISLGDDKSNIKKKLDDYSISSAYEDFKEITGLAAFERWVKGR